VRGTEFIFITNPDEAIDHLMVREGEVFVEGKVSGSVVLTTRQQVVARGGVVGAPQPFSERDWAEAAAMCGAPEPEQGTTASRCEGLLGRWRWFNGAMVECFPDGSCVASNGFDATWTCLEPKGRFEIRWAQPGQTVPYVDTVGLSADGWELEGVNQSGQGVGGQRPEFEGGEPASGCDSLIGSWRWANGATVQCGADGRCASDRDVSGPWRCINETGRFEIRWGRVGRPDQFIDNVVVSPLGTYLTGKNQYGVATGATRE
jgi:hypothetical protein